MKPITSNPSESSSLVAKLLATENIKIVYDSKMETAMFDTHSRVLSMPILKQENDNDNFANEMMLAHEVGHALFTPAGAEPLMAAINSIAPQCPKAVKSFLNIIEDARIERNMQEQYKGLRRTFFQGYNSLLKNHNLFDEVLSNNIADLPLIDRINLHFKLGMYTGMEIPFSTEEQKFVDAVGATQSWQDVVDVTRQIFQDQMEQDEKEEQEIDGDGDGDGDDEGEYGVGQRIGYGMGTDKKLPFSGGSRIEESGYTQTLIDSALNKQKDHNSGASGSSIVPVFDTEKGIFSTADVIKCLKESSSWGNTSIIDAVIKYNRSSVQQMVADFERKKAATEFQRATTSRTGTLDMNKLHQYKLDDELFMTSLDIRKGKSHGIVIVLDWSSSMSYRMFSCLVQLSCLTSFCRSVKIPYEVYAFSDGNVNQMIFEPCDDDRRWDSPKDLKHFAFRDGVANISHGDCGIPNGMNVSNTFSMIRFTGSELPQKVENTILNQMLMQHYNDKVADSMGILNAAITAMRHKAYSVPQSEAPQTLLSLSGTPLDEAMLACIEIIPAFQKHNNVDMVSTVFLTDGDSTSHVAVTLNQKIDPSTKEVSYSHDYPCDNTTFIHKNVSYFVANTGGETHKCGLFIRDLFRKLTGSNLINFFMRDAHGFARWKNMYVLSFTTEIENGSMIVADDYMEQRDFNGWDIYFTVAFEDKPTTASDVADAMNEATTVVKIRNAFMKGMTRIGNSRVLLNRMTDYFTKKAGTMSATRKKLSLDADREN